MKKHYFSVALKNGDLQFKQEDHLGPDLEAKDFFFSATVVNGKLLLEQEYLPNKEQASTETNCSKHEQTNKISEEVNYVKKFLLKDKKALIGYLKNEVQTKETVIAILKDMSKHKKQSLKMLLAITPHLHLIASYDINIDFVINTITNYYHTYFKAKKFLVPKWRMNEEAGFIRRYINICLKLPKHLEKIAALAISDTINIVIKGGPKGLLQYEFYPNEYFEVRDADIDFYLEQVGKGNVSLRDFIQKSNIIVNYKGENNDNWKRSEDIAIATMETLLKVPLNADGWDQLGALAIYKQKIHGKYKDTLKLLKTSNNKHLRNLYYRIKSK